MDTAALSPQAQEFARSIDADREVLRQMSASVHRSACHIQRSKTLIARSRSLLDRLAVRLAPPVVANSCRDLAETLKQLTDRSDRRDFTG